MLLLLLATSAPMVQASSIISIGEVHRYDDRMVLHSSTGSQRLTISEDGNLSMWDGGVGTPSLNWSVRFDVTVLSSAHDTAQQLVLIGHETGVLEVNLRTKVLSRNLTTTSRADGVHGMTRWSWAAHIESGARPDTVGNRRCPPFNTIRGCRASMSCRMGESSLEASIRFSESTTSPENAFVPSRTPVESSRRCGRRPQGICGRARARSGPCVEHHLMDVDQCRHRLHLPVTTFDPGPGGEVLVGCTNGAVAIVAPDPWRRTFSDITNGPVLELVLGSDGTFWRQRLVQRPQFRSSGMWIRIPMGVTDQLDPFPSDPSQSADSIRMGTGTTLRHESRCIPTGSNPMVRSRWGWLR